MDEKILDLLAINDDVQSVHEDFLLWEQLISARKKAGLSQTQLAILMGTKPSAVSRMENNTVNSPSIRTIRRYAEIVGCELHIQLKPRSPITPTAIPCLVLPLAPCLNELDY